MPCNRGRIDVMTLLQLREERSDDLTTIESPPWFVLSLTVFQPDLGAQLEGQRLIDRVAGNTF